MGHLRNILLVLGASGIGAAAWLSIDKYAARPNANLPEQTGFLRPSNETGRVKFVASADSLVLSSGSRVKLASIEGPKKSWPEKALPGWPLHEEAIAALQEMIGQGVVQLSFGDDVKDRYDRVVAQVWLLDDKGEKETWLQEAMLLQGYARVYTLPDQRMDVSALYDAERAARRAKRGIWDNAQTGGFYDVRSPDPNNLSQFVDSVQVIEGIIVSVADIKGTTYLNFGADYKTDFTIAVPGKGRTAFKKTDIDLLGLRGANVRVRGWVEMQNGPVIWLTDPNRLEILQ